MADKIVEVSKGGGRVAIKESQLSRYLSKGYKLHEKSEAPKKKPSKKKKPVIEKFTPSWE